MCNGRGVAEHYVRLPQRQMWYQSKQAERIMRIHIGLRIFRIFHLLLFVPGKYHQQAVAWSYICSELPTLSLSPEAPKILRPHPQPPLRFQGD